MPGPGHYPTCFAPAQGGFFTRTGEWITLHARTSTPHHVAQSPPLLSSSSSALSALSAGFRGQRAARTDVVAGLGRRAGAALLASRRRRLPDAQPSDVSVHAGWRRCGV